MNKFYPLDYPGVHNAGYTDSVFGDDKLEIQIIDRYIYYDFLIHLKNTASSVELPCRC
jgi:hypothetical protein